METIEQVLLILGIQKISRQLSESTQKLFKAIDDKNLEDFKQVMAEGVNVNAFNEESMTPLMSIINTYTVSSYGQSTLEIMAKLLIQNKKYRY
ncbi:MAG: hypothetical protein ACR5KV_01160 [Wolbachia sp.]